MKNEMIEQILREADDAIRCKLRTVGTCLEDDDKHSLIRTIIEAMREPTEAMIEAFWRMDGGAGSHAPYDGPEPTEAWRAMIEAALAG